MKKNYYAKALALTVAASMVSVPAFAEENGTETAALQADAEGETAETENKAVTLPLLDEEKPVTVADAEEEEPTETPAETTTHGTTENEPVALAEEETQGEIEISSAEQIYALARALGDNGTEADYNLVKPAVTTEPAEDADVDTQADEITGAQKEELQKATYKLANDIELTNTDDKGNAFYGIPNFKGTFDGQGKTIEVAFNIKNAELTGNAIGCLFSTLDGGTVENVNFTGSFEIEANATKSLQDIAVVVGMMNGAGSAPNKREEGSTLKNIKSSVTVTLDFESTGNDTCVYAGAMVGRACHGKDKLINCENTGDLTATYKNFEINGGCRLGGLVGHAYSGVSFDGCKNSGNVDTSESGDTRTMAGGMVGSGSNNVYTDCELSGNVKGSGGYAVYAYPNMGKGGEGNVLVATVTGEAGQVIAYGSETKTIGGDGKVTFEIPIENKNGFVENNAFSYEQYLTVNGARLDWYNLDNTELTLKLNSADAGDLSVPFQTERDALEINDEATLLNIQKALNEGNHEAIDALYALRDKTVDADGYSEAKAALQTAYYKLGKDVTITNPAYTGIGTQTTPFSGHFDGQGYTVTLQPTSEVTAGYYGLFGYLNSGANGVPEIENLKVVVNADVEINAANSYVGTFAGRTVAGNLKNVTATVEKLNVTGTASSALHVGGLAGSNTANSMENVSVEVNGPLTVTASSYVIRLGGAFGAGSPSDPLTITYNKGAQLKAENTTGTINLGGFIGYRDGATVDLRGCKQINNDTESPLVISAKGPNTILAGGWIGFATAATSAADDWIYIDNTSKMQGDFSVEAEPTGSAVSFIGGVIGKCDVSYSVSIENYINRAKVKGQYIGGLIGNPVSGDSKKVVLKNSANIGALEETNTAIPGGLIGFKGNVTLDSEGGALYIKTTKVKRGVGHPTDTANPTGMVGFETAKVTPAEGETFTFGEPIENILTANAPAALTIDGKAEFNGTGLVYTEAGNQTLKFLWNGEEIYETTVNVAQKELKTADVTVTGVNSAYASDDEAAKADIKVVYDGKVLVEGTDYTVEQDKDSHKFTITFEGNYKGTAEKTYSTENAFDVTVNDYVGNYDGDEHGIDVTKVPEGVTMKYGTSAGTYNEDSVTRTNAGTTVVYWQATKGQQTVTGTALIQINKAPVTLTADRTSMRGAGTVTLTVNGVVEGETVATGVSCDDTSITVNGNGNTYTAYLPNATKTYTFTATGTNSDYEWKDNSCTVSVSRKKSSSSSDTSAPTYGVSTGKTENGTISVTPAKAEAGEKVTIKATPDSGYQLDKVTVKDKNNGNVKLTKVSDNEYTFTMPTGKVSVDATFVQKDAADDNQNNAGEKSKVIKLQIGSRIVTVDNEAVIYDVAPVIRNDRTLVPIRIVTETLGGKVDWNGVTKEVTLNIDGKEIKMTVGKTLEKYGVAPVIIDGRTFVPVRFVADELGATVAWDDATKTVTITKIEK